MSDTLTKPHPTVAEAIIKQGSRAPVIPPRHIPEAILATATPAEAAEKANDDQPVIVGSQRTRKHAANASHKKNSVTSTWVYDTDSGIAYELEYDDGHTKLWTYKHPSVMILEYRTRHVGIEGERLTVLLDSLSARRLSELSAAAHPELDPKIETIEHVRRVVVRPPGFIRIREGTLEVRDEWEDEPPVPRLRAIEPANA